MARRYPEEVRAFIYENAYGRTTRELTEMVNARFGLSFTEKALKAYKQKYGLKSGLRRGRKKGSATDLFPQPVVDYIRANYIGVGPTEMAKRLNEKFGTSYTAQQLNSYYKNHGLNSGLTGRFEKGHNRGRKWPKGQYAPGCEKGFFRSGQLPNNTKPIGYERETKSGYIEIKIAMRPSAPNRNDNFTSKQRYVWEQTHGPIPAGMEVIFKDGNKRNFDPDNLALVTRAEKLEMNRRGFFSSDAELTEAGLMVSRVRTKIYDKRRKQKGKGERE